MNRVFALARCRAATYSVKLLIHNPLLLQAPRGSWYVARKQQHVRFGIINIDRPVKS